MGGGGNKIKIITNNKENKSNKTAFKRAKNAVEKIACRFFFKYIFSGRYYDVCVVISQTSERPALHWDKMSSGQCKRRAGK